LIQKLISNLTPGTFYLQNPPFESVLAASLAPMHIRVAAGPAAAASVVFMEEAAGSTLRQEGGMYVCDDGYEQSSVSYGCMQIVLALTDVWRNAAAAAGNLVW
jgi:hypothetical protein